MKSKDQIATNLKISENRKGKGTGPRSPEITTICPCGKSFQQKQNNARQLVFCSRKCRADKLGQEKQEATMRAYDLDPVRCPCGNAIPYEYRHTKMYCDKECRMEYGEFRSKDPTKYITFDCETCGEVVTRRKSYGTNPRFCSNRCAAKSNRTIQHISVDGVILDSGYEALVWGLGRLHKLPIERFDRGNNISFLDEEGKERWYGPDFLIAGIPVEIKGYEEQDDRDRYKAWRATGQRLSVIRKEDLTDLRLAESPGDFLVEIEYRTIHSNVL